MSNIQFIGVILSAAIAPAFVRSLLTEWHARHDYAELALPDENDR